MSENSPKSREGELPLDLWPEEIAPANVTPPATILQSQASLLTKRTKYKLRGSVVTTNLGGSLRHSFLLVAPTLQDYRYELFEVAHGVMPYPVSVYSAPKGVSTAEIPDEHSFVEWLRSVLASDETKRIIGALLAQV